MTRHPLNFQRLLVVLANSVLAVLILSVSALSHAEPVCGRVNAYWETNMAKLAENLSECSSFRWHKCSQAAAIYYDLKAGSLAKRAHACGLNTPVVPGSDYTQVTSSDSRQCALARDSLREVFENRAQARLACAAARTGGDNQQWLDAQCKLHRSRMANYHNPFRSMARSCEIDYKRIIAQG